MTNRRTSPLPEVTTIGDLPHAERISVWQEQETLDWDGLASAARMSRRELEQLPELSGMRGAFRTPYRLLAATVGYGYGGRPAVSVGHVLHRLGFTVDSYGRIDRDNYRRVLQAADFFGIELPDQGQDGPAHDSWWRHGDELFIDAWYQASTMDELCGRLDQDPAGPAARWNRMRGAALGLPTWFGLCPDVEALLRTHGPADVAAALRLEQLLGARAVSPADPSPPSRDKKKKKKKKKKGKGKGKGKG